MIEAGIGSLVAADLAIATSGDFSTELCGPFHYADDLLERPLAIRDGAIWLDEASGPGRAVDRARLEPLLIG